MVTPALVSSVARPASRLASASIRVTPAAMRNLGPLPLRHDVPSDQQHRQQIEAMHALQDWWVGVGVWERLRRHQTLASARQRRSWSSDSEDRLDLALGARYHHADDVFASTARCCLQPETAGEPTSKVLRNELPALPKRELAHGHPLQIRDLGQRDLRHQVKPDPSADHLVLTRPNYNRRRDGAFFKV